jgi:hypothetical protein
MWFPTADVASMITRRPTLLLDDQWEHVSHPPPSSGVEREQFLPCQRGLSEWGYVVHFCSRQGAN